MMNARRVAEAGAGILIEQAFLTGEGLAGELIALLDDLPRLEQMESRCDSLFPGDAARQIVGSCLRLVGWQPAD